MSLKSALFELVAIRMPRARGFSKKFYFAHPFLDAWFAWFPLNQIQYDGAPWGKYSVWLQELMKVKAQQVGLRSGQKKVIG